MSISHASLDNCMKCEVTFPFNFSGYGSVKQRIGSDSQLPFGYCSLSMVSLHLLILDPCNCKDFNFSFDMESTLQMKVLVL